MQKQKKQLIAVLVMLVLCGVAYVAINRYNESQEKKEAERTKSELIHVTSFSNDDIIAFSYIKDNETLSFEKDADGNWNYDGDKKVDIDESAVKTMLSNILDMTAKEEITAPDKSEDYGFEAPQQVVTITTADKTVTLTLGAKNTINNNYYLKSSESGSIYMVDGTLSTAFSKTIADLTVKQTADEESTSK